MTGQRTFIPASEAEDISHAVFGKYQYCTERDGIIWSDADFADGQGNGALRRGAMPAPHQHTREAQVIADAMRAGDGYQPPEKHRASSKGTVVDNSPPSNIWLTAILLAIGITAILLVYLIVR